MGPTPSTYLMTAVSRREREQRFSCEVGGSLCILGVAWEAPDCKAEGNYAARARLPQGENEKVGGQRGETAAEGRADGEQEDTDRSTDGVRDRSVEQWIACLGGGLFKKKMYCSSFDVSIQAL